MAAARNVTYGSRGKRTTLGLPGSGMSWTQYQPYQRKAVRSTPPSVAAEASPRNYIPTWSLLLAAALSIAATQSGIAMAAVGAIVIYWIAKWWPRAVEISQAEEPLLLTEPAPPQIPIALLQKKDATITSTRIAMNGLNDLIRSPEFRVKFSDADCNELHVFHDLLEQYLNGLNNAVQRDAAIFFLDRIAETMDRVGIIFDRLRGQLALGQILGAQS